MYFTCGHMDKQGLKNGLDAGAIYFQISLGTYLNFLISFLSTKFLLPMKPDISATKYPL